MQTELQQRISRIKTTALMRAREHMGPVELTNWWTTFKKNTNELKSFADLDETTQAQILEWEAHPYIIIGTGHDR